VAFYLGTESGLTHTWTDYSVTNGQEYFYGVCAYDYGADAPFNFPPSENDLAVNRTPRGGIVLPPTSCRSGPIPAPPASGPPPPDTALQVARTRAGGSGGPWRS